MADLLIDKLTKSYETFTAVDGIDVHIRDGEFFTLLGPSGCGKSTTLWMIAGLERPTGGRIAAGGVEFFNAASGRFLPPEQRNCGLVFQAYALWPHMTVAQNLAYPLKLRGMPRAERSRRIAEMLAVVDLDRHAGRYPFELSGGQQQRVALARTLVYNPALLLLDEPLSNLDAKLRDRARAWLAEMSAKFRTTTVYVTHDQTEALTLSSRIAVMDGGKIVQVGTPREIYEAPATPFVADFVGTTNFLTGRMEAAGAAGDADLSMVVLEDGQTLLVPTPPQMTPGVRVSVAIRPEGIETLSIRPAQPDGRSTLLTAKPVATSYLGPRFLYTILIGGSEVKAESRELIASEELYLRIPAESCLVFPDR